METPWRQHGGPGVSANPDDPKVPLHHFLEASARRHPSLPATIFFDATLTYSELDGLANQVAHALIEMGIRKGDRVALLLPNSPQFIVSFYGVLKAGAVVVANNPLSTAEELTSQLNRAGAATIIALSKLYPTVQTIMPATSLKNVIVTNIKEYTPRVLRVLFTLFRERTDGHRVKLAPGHLWFRDWIGGQPASAPAVNVGPDDVALYQFGGNITGVSREVSVSHRALVTDTLRVNARLPDRREGEETYLAVIPFFHVYGLVACLSVAVYQAARMVILPQFRVEDVLKVVEKYRPTLFPGLPAMYIAIHNYPQTHKYDLHSIRACISNGPPLPVEMKNQFEKLLGGTLNEVRLEIGD
jgi:long-chain acyl-CoA synthetase